MLFSVVVALALTACHVSGQQASLYHRQPVHFLQGLQAGSGRLPLRLVLADREKESSAPGQQTAGSKVLDLDLKSGSVWTSRSSAAVKGSNGVQPVTQGPSPNCFFVGKVNGETGSMASLNLCGQAVSGVVMLGQEVFWLTPEDVLVSDGVQNSEQEQLSLGHLSDVVNGARHFRVRREAETDSDSDDNGYEGDEVFDDDDDEEDDDTSKEEEGSDEEPEDQDRQKKDTGGEESSDDGLIHADIEVAIYLDPHYREKLESKGYDTPEKQIDFMIHRWNLIKAVYADVDGAGMDIDVQLKYIELWDDFPEWYDPEAWEDRLGRQMKAFCQQELAPDADHKMLYTLGVPGGLAGLAMTGGICNPVRKCAAINAFRENKVKAEVHELGHNLGLKHTNEIGDCVGGGFMGGSKGMEWLECYRRVLQQNMVKKSRECLFTQNVDMPVLNVGGDE